MRKCEIHLPLNYRDGNPIEQEKIDRVRGNYSPNLVHSRDQIGDRGDTTDNSALKSRGSKSLQLMTSLRRNDSKNSRSASRNVSRKSTS